VVARNQANPLPILVDGVQATQADESLKMAAVPYGVALNPPVFFGGAFEPLRFTERMKLIRKIQEKKKTVLMSVLSPPGNTPAAERLARTRLGLAVYLLIEDDKSFLSVPDEPEADVAAWRNQLGKAIGPAEKTNDGLWVRRYEKGRVILNPDSDKPISIPVENIRRLSDGTAIEKGAIELQRGDAEILYNKD
jgi:hypothetical protein